MALCPNPNPSSHLFPLSYHPVDRRHIMHCQKVTVKKIKGFFLFMATSVAAQLFKYLPGSLLFIITHFLWYSLWNSIPIAQVGSLICIIAVELPAKDKLHQKTFLGFFLLKRNMAQGRGWITSCPWASEGKCNVCTGMAKICFLLLSVLPPQGCCAAQVKTLQCKRLW